MISIASRTARLLCLRAKVEKGKRYGPSRNAACTPPKGRWTTDEKVSEDEGDLGVAFRSSSIRYFMVAQALSFVKPAYKRAPRYTCRIAIRAREFVSEERYANSGQAKVRA